MQNQHTWTLPSSWISSLPTRPGRACITVISMRNFFHYNFFHCNFFQVNWPNGDFSTTSGFEICVPDKASLLTCHWRLHLGAPMWLYQQHLQWTVLYKAESATSTLPSAWISDWITSLPTRLSKACITVISITKSISFIITRHFKSFTSECFYCWQLSLLAATRARRVLPALLRKLLSNNYTCMEIEEISTKPHL